MNLLHSIFIKIGMGLIALGSLLGAHFTIDQQQPVAPTYGAYYPTGGGTYRLNASVGTSDTSITLSSFKEPVSNIKYTMSYLNSDIEYGTLDPQTSISEFISFTGITQNADGSATLTGVVRGLARTPGTGGCVASTTLAQSHAGQSIFILSNPPCQLAEYIPLRTNATSSAILVFGSTTPPRYDLDNQSMWATATGTTLIDLYKLNATAFGGGVVNVPTGGTNNTSVSGNSLIASNEAGTVLSSTSTSPLYVGSIVATTTATSTFGGAITVQGQATSTFSKGVQAPTLNITSNSASSTASNGFDISSGCYAISGTCLPRSQQYTLLESTTTQQAMRFATSTWSGTYQNLRVVITSTTTQAISDNRLLRFNGDAGTNYGYRVVADDQNASIGEVNSAATVYALTGGSYATTTQFTVFMDIVNNPTGRKYIHSDFVMSDSGTHAPVTVVGNGVWNNTAAPITSITLQSGSNLPAGIRFDVYGY